MPVRLHIATALLALVALALPAAAAAVSAVGLCGVPCEEPAPCDAMHDMPGHDRPAPDAPAPDAPAPETAECCIGLDTPVGTEVVLVPAAERLVDLPRLLLPSLAPAPPFRAAQAPDRPPAPALRTHLAFSVLLI